MTTSRPVALTVFGVAAVTALAACGGLDDQSAGSDAEGDGGAVGDR